MGLTDLSHNPDSLNLPGPPRRVVSLVPSVTASLFDLGLGGTLVGITDFCVYPPEGVARLPKVGGTKNPDIAAILALNPDLIIANQEENHREQVQALQAAGLPVWLTFPRTVRQGMDFLWDTIRLFGMPHLSQTLTALEKSLEWTSLAADNRPAPRVFVPIWRAEADAGQPPAWWMTLNAETYAHDVLRVCGADNIFAGRARRYPLAADLDEAHPADAPQPGQDTRYPRVTPAEIAALAPDVILLPSEPYAFGPDDARLFDAWPDIPAVRDGRIHLIDGSLLTWPGTRLALALAELPGLVEN